MSETILKRHEVESWLLRGRPEGEIAADHHYGSSLSYWVCNCNIRRPRVGECNECTVCGCVDAGPACDLIL